MIHLILGAILFQVVLMGIQFALFRKPEYGYYGLFLLSLLSLVVFYFLPAEVTLGWVPSDLTRQVPSRILLAVALALHWRFIRYLVAAPGQYPRFNRVVVLVEWVLLGMALLDLLLIVVYRWPADTLRPLFLGVNYALLPLNLIAGLFILAQGQKLTTLTAAGSILFMFMGRLVVLSVLEIEGEVAEDDLLLLGGLVVLHAVLFSFCLLYKTRQQQEELLRVEQERYQGVLLNQRELSMDLHDEVGSSLSGVHVMLAYLEKLMERDKAKAREVVLQLALDVAKVMENINQLTRSIEQEPQARSVFFPRLFNYLAKVLEAQGMELQLEVDRTLANRIENRVVRKNMKLIMKEAVNNCLKHSRAQRVLIQLDQTGALIRLVVSDDGVGLQQHAAPEGTGFGLRNMQKRAVQMGGQLSLSGSPGQGTTLTCLIPVANACPAAEAVEASVFSQEILRF
jgi:signal transduction histidine kinase